MEGRARWELVGLPESLQPAKPRCQHHKELLLPLGLGTPSTGTLGAPTGAAREPLPSAGCPFQPLPPPFCRGSRPKIAAVGFT